jgi:hypothetical protein
MVKHYIEEKDAALCMDGKQCVSLGLEIAQLIEIGMLQILNGIWTESVTPVCWRLKFFITALAGMKQ